MRTRTSLILCAAALLLGASSCREAISEKPPVHLQRNMATQQKYKPQSESRWFEDGATMRTPVEHTVARGELRADDALYRGKAADGRFVDSPVAFTPDVLARGKQRYGIYCLPCHGELGNGRGPVITKYTSYSIPPVSYFDPRILQAEDGYIFDVISNGIRNMASYKAQIPVADRWSIVGHVRELQKAQLPDSLRGYILPQTAAAK
jgi:hypothetical protein